TPARYQRRIARECTGFGCGWRRHVAPRLLTRAPRMLSVRRPGRRRRRSGAHNPASTPLTASRPQSAAAAAAGAASMPHSGNTAQTRAAHARRANAIRALARDGVEQAKSGHPGLPMGAADVATVLFTQFLKFDPADPAWPDRDRFVLSAGHGSMLIYALLHLLGYEQMTIDQIKRFRQLGSITAGHPEYCHPPRRQTTTGPLRPGPAHPGRLAMAGRPLPAPFRRALLRHPTPL